MVRIIYFKIIVFFEIGVRKKLYLFLNYFYLIRNIFWEGEMGIVRFILDFYLLFRLFFWRKDGRVGGRDGVGEGRLIGFFECLGFRIMFRFLGGVDVLY